jgi:predicted GIY-YIG superfamily endonuclease
LLQLGLNYSLPVKDIRGSMIDSAATIELKMLNLELNENNKDEIRCGVSRIMRRHVTRANFNQPWDSWISNSIKSLISDKSLCICKADKGNSIVLLNKIDYSNKMIKMLQDGPYEKVFDPTSDIANQVTTKCKELLERKKISEGEHNALVIKDPRPPIIYGAPKIHKKDVPLRPIVDFRKSPTYKIAAYISKILKPLASNHSLSVKNSFEFVQEIKKVKPRCGDIKVSFDVESLFTKVPILETMEYIKWKLENCDSLIDITSLDIKDILELLKICLSSTYFNYLDAFYHQKEGTAMGSPVSPIVAELFLQSLENKLVMNDRHIFFWKRYVDDIFAIIRRRHLKKLLENLNNFHKSIKFTIEEEEEGRLAFLDVMVYEKADGTLGHRVYRKTTHTNKYLNYHSYHPMPHKIGVVDTLFTRAFRLSDEEHLQEEIITTIDILEKNEYPEDFLLRRLRRVKDKINSPPQITTNDKRIVLPWAGIVTNKISQFIRRKLNIQFGYFPGPKLCTILCNAKQKPEKLKCGVYSIKCKNCPLVYVGETERDYMTRIKEHEQDIRRAAIRKSPIALHMLENDHELDPDSYKLILKEPRKYFRKFKEGLYIRQATHKMNTSKGMPINSLWSSTLVHFLNFSTH